MILDSLQKGFSIGFTIAGAGMVVIGFMVAVFIILAIVGGASSDKNKTNK